MSAGTFSILLASALVFLGGQASAIVIDLSDHLTYTGANGEADGTEFSSFGLFLTTSGIAFNVGCAADPCLSADAVQLNDFSGTITGNFVVPGTSIDALVTSLSIVLCCASGTVTELFDRDGGSIARIVHQSAIYAGPTPVSSFAVDLSNDGIFAIEFDGLTAVPEPSNALLVGLGLVAIAARRRWAR